MPRGLLPGRGDGHPGLSAVLGFSLGSSEPFSRRDPGRSSSAQGDSESGGRGDSQAPGGQEDASSGPPLWTPAFSGPHCGKSPRPVQKAELPGPLWCLCCCRQDDRRCPCRAQGRSGEGQHDDIHRASGWLLTRLLSLSCCVLQAPSCPRYRTEDCVAWWSQLQTAGPGSQRRLGLGRSEGGSASGGLPQRTKGCRDADWPVLAQQGHSRW